VIASKQAFAKKRSRSAGLLSSVRLRLAGPRPQSDAQGKHRIAGVDVLIPIMIPCCGLDREYGILDKSLLGKEFGSIKDMTTIVNECRNSCVCAPDEKPVLLNGSENAQVEVLPGGR
jgi:hypothetical protein